MDGYTGVPGRVIYFGEDKENRQFSLWSRIDDIKPLVYVYVPKLRVERDHNLEIVCKGAINVDSGFMVTMPRWESKVTPEGNLRTL